MRQARKIPDASLEEMRILIKEVGPEAVQETAGHAFAFRKAEQYPRLSVVTDQRFAEIGRAVIRQDLPSLLRRR